MDEYIPGNRMKTAYSKVRVIVWVIILFAGTANLQAQVRIVGVVTDEKNEPVENVRVSCSDTLHTVQTNSRGEYSIEVSDHCKALYFTYHDTTFIRKPVKGSVINVQLHSSENISKTRDYRFNIMLNGGGAVVWGSISGSFLVTDFLSLDVGLGLGKVYGGTTVYFNSPFKNKNWQPFVGLNIAYFEEFMGPTSTLLYMPAGLRFLNERGTSVSFESGLLRSNNDRFVLNTPIWGGIRFGKYF